MSDERWCLIFSDGTGQRGVRDDASALNTNVFRMFLAAEGLPGFEVFYDAGLGAPPELGDDDEALAAGADSLTRKLRNVWSKATGWGITANIVECYEALMMRWEPGMRIGFFGFSRGAYTVRCLGGVLSTCGIATVEGGAPISRDQDSADATRRRRIAEEAVAAYKIRDAAQRRSAGKAFAGKYGAAAVAPDVIGVFDTVKALGLPGIMNVVNPYRHEFHDTELSTRVPVGLQALSIDENRKVFAPVLWDDASGSGQIIEQCWFPGVHSDVGGGYGDDNRLADLALAWMLARLRSLVGLQIPIPVTADGKILGRTHDERTGFGKFWTPGTRSIMAEAVDRAALCHEIERRFDGNGYRPPALGDHPRVAHYYTHKAKRVSPERMAVKPR